MTPHPLQPLSALTHTTQFAFTNERATAAEVLVEPWAFDYTVAPGERLEFRVHSAPPGVWFNVVQRAGNAVQVYVEGPGPGARVEWEVRIDGADVRVGHGRRP